MSTIPNTTLRTGAPSYGRCPRDLLRDGSISDRAKVLYVLLDDYADADGKAFPSRATLSDSLGCSTDSVDRAVAELVDAGWLSKEVRRKDDRSYKSTLYTMIWDRAGVAAQVRVPSRMGADTLAAPMPTEEEPQEDESLKEEPLPIAGATGVVSEQILDSAFIHFWAAYPRKVGKAKARQAFGRAVRRKGPTIANAASDITDACRYMAADPNLPTKDLIPHPTTWLNRDGWEDEPYPPRSGTQAPRTAGESYTGEGRVMTGAEWDTTERNSAHG